MYRTLHTRKHKEGGFSLVEMIVAIGIFLTAFVIILGALMSTNNAARKTRSARIVNDNLSAAIDSMARGMRVGNTFHCGCVAPYTTVANCPMTDNTGGGGDTCVAFESQLGSGSDPNDQIVYRLNGGTIERSTQSGAVGTYVPLTAPELSISKLRFYVEGTDNVSPGKDQPVITILIAGSASTTARTATYFNVQTTVSAYTPNL